MILRLRRKLLKDSEEGAGTFIFNFLLFPVLLGFFGLAFDFSAAFWARGALQQYLDAATQSSLGQLANPTTTPSFNVSNVTTTNNFLKARAQQQYSINRLGTPFLACQSGGNSNPSVPGGNITVAGDGCPYSLQGNTKFTSSPISFTMTVHEETRFMFLRVIGFYYQGYNLRSTATLTTSYNNN